MCAGAPAPPGWNARSARVFGCEFETGWFRVAPIQFFHSSRGLGVRGIGVKLIDEIRPETQRGRRPPDGDPEVAAYLKRRGLLDETLVIWTGEFGRTSTSQNGKGRDHNPRGFTTWMAGGGVEGGQVVGATDDFGYAAVENKVHVHDLHATALHLMGLDHTLLTYFHAGRNMRFTDVHGRVVKELVG